MHPIEALWARHHPPGGQYPVGVIGVPAPIPGRAFFPGGYGLLGVEHGRPLPAVPVGGIMILGHDFHSEAGYRKSFAAGGEPESIPTWKNLLALLREVGVHPEACFYTNMFMGLRKGAATTGEFPGATNEPFVAHCRAFFLDQLQLQRPSLVLTLGMYVPGLVAPLSPKLADWGTGRGIKHLDSVGPLRTGVRFGHLSDYSTTFAALIHPSLRFGSLRYRKYRDNTGAAAEHQLLRDALDSSRAAAV